MAPPLILVTGFSAFNGCPNNPTEELVSYLHRKYTGLLGAHVLPVAAQCVDDFLAKEVSGPATGAAS